MPGPRLRGLAFLGGWGWRAGVHLCTWLVQLVICTRVMFRIHGNYRQIGPVIRARGNKKGAFCMFSERCSSFQTSRLPSTQPHPPPIVRDLVRVNIEAHHPTSPPHRFPPTLTIHPPPSPPPMVRDLVPVNIQAYPLTPFPRRHLPSTQPPPLCVSWFA